MALKGTKSEESKLLSNQLIGMFSIFPHFYQILRNASPIFPAPLNPLTLARRHLERNHSLPMLKRPINPKKPLAIKLHNIIHFEFRHIAIRQRLCARLCTRIQEILQRILRLEFILCDEIIEIDKLDGNEILVGAEPRYFLCGFLDVALEMEFKFEGGYGLEFEGVEGVADFADESVAPVHEGDFLVLGERSGVGLFEEHAGAKGDLLGAEVVFGVFGLVLRLDAFASADDGDGDFGVFIDGGVARGGGLDVFLVGCPEGEPVLVDNILGRALLEDEFAESGDDGTATTDTADGGHAGVVPAPDNAGVDNLGELALGQDGFDKVQAREAPVVDLAQLEVVNEPLVLCITVVVLGGTQGVRHPLERIDNRAAEVVGGVDLPCVSSAVMCLGVAAVDDGVAHGFVRVVDRHLCADAPLEALVAARLHQLEPGQVVLDAGVAAGTGNAVHTLVAHLHLLRVVCIRETILDHLHTRVVQLLEPVTGVRHRVGLDAQERAILDNRILVFLLLLGRVGIVEAQQELALVLLVRKVVVEEGGLCVADVEVASVERSVSKLSNSLLRGLATYDGSGGKRVTMPDPSPTSCSPIS
jgi:hypothetical protein